MPPPAEAAGQAGELCQPSRNFGKEVASILAGFGAPAITAL